MPGQVPKRSNEIMGHVAKRKLQERSEGNAPAGETVTVPEKDDQWHPIAQNWYESLKESGQRVFYESSDWMTAYYVAEAMSRSLRSDTGLSPSLFIGVLRASNELLTTEGARRRLRLELQKEPTTQERDTHVAAIANYRKAVAG